MQLLEVDVLGTGGGGAAARARDVDDVGTRSPGVKRGVLTAGGGGGVVAVRVRRTIAGGGGGAGGGAGVDLARTVLEAGAGVAEGRVGRLACSRVTGVRSGAIGGSTPVSSAVPAPAAHTMPTQTAAVLPLRALPQRASSVARRRLHTAWHSGHPARCTTTA